MFVRDVLNFNLITLYLRSCWSGLETMTPNTMKKVCTFHAGYVIFSAQQSNQRSNDRFFADNINFYRTDSMAVICTSASSGGFCLTNWLSSAKSFHPLAEGHTMTLPNIYLRFTEFEIIIHYSQNLHINRDERQLSRFKSQLLWLFCVTIVQITFEVT